MKPEIKAILEIVLSTLWNDSEDYSAFILDNGGSASTFIINSRYDGSIIFSANMEWVLSVDDAKAIARAALICVAYNQLEINDILK